MSHRQTEALALRCRFVAFLVAGQTVPIAGHLQWPDIAAFAACIRGVATVEQEGKDVRVVLEPGADEGVVLQRLASLRDLRRDVCCHAEPECLLCPLRPEQARRSILELEAEGLYARGREVRHRLAK